MSSAADREYRFYRTLCAELLQWGNDNQFEIHMAKRKQQEMQNMWHRYYKIRDEEENEENALLTLRNMKTFLNDIIRFMRRRLPLRSCTGNAPEYLNMMLPLRNWRWEELIKRAEHWRSRAREYDWTLEDSLQIQPQWPDQEPWWNDARTIAFCSSGPFTLSNPFVVWNTARFEF